MKRFDLLKNAPAALPHDDSAETSDDDAMSTDNLDVVDRLQKMAWEAGHIKILYISCVILCYFDSRLVVQLSDTRDTPATHPTPHQARSLRRETAKRLGRELLVSRRKPRVNRRSKRTLKAAAAAAANEVVAAARALWP